MKYLLYFCALASIITLGLLSGITDITLGEHAGFAVPPILGALCFGAGRASAVATPIRTYRRRATDIHAISAGVQPPGAAIVRSSRSEADAHEALRLRAVRTLDRTIHRTNRTNPTLTVRH